MKLNITNVGKIGSATFEFNGITVIVGNNNTGKSTVGKSLFALFHRFLNINKAMKSYRYNALIKRVRNLDIKYGPSDSWMYSPEELAQRYNLKKISELTENNLEISDLPDLISSSVVVENADKDDFYEELLSGLNDVKSIGDKRLKEEIITQFFNNIFASQINNVQNKSSNAILELEIKSKPLRVEFKDGKCILVDDDIALTNKAIYIDDPYAIDINFRYRHYGHNIGREQINNILSRFLHKSNSEDLVDKIIDPPPRWASP